MFPNYKIKKWLFFKKEIKDGWEDLGEMRMGYNEEKRTYQAYCCGICNDIARIGKENGETFRYCPRCLIKI